MSANSIMTEPKPTWLRVTNTALHVVPAILGSHQTTSTIARAMPSTPCATCLRLGRQRLPGTESSSLTALPRAVSRQTGEDVARGGRARRVGWVDVPLAAEDHVVERSRDTQEGGESAVRTAICAGLRDVGSHRGPFCGRVTDDVDPVGDVGLRAECALERGGVEGCREAVDLASQGHRAADRVTRHGRLQHPWSLGQLCCTYRDLVSLHMIAVSIAAVDVVGQHDVEVLLPQDGGERRLEELRESARALGVARVEHLGYADSGLGPH